MLKKFCIYQIAIFASRNTKPSLYEDREYNLWNRHNVGVFNKPILQHILTSISIPFNAFIITKYSDTGDTFILFVGDHVTNMYHNKNNKLITFQSH